MADEVLSRSPNRGLYTAVTQKIIAAIEAGAATCRMPWHSMGKPISLPTNALTRHEYRGANILALWVTSLNRRYTSGTWATYKQWKDLGAQVRRGETGTLIVFYKQLEVTPLEEQDPDQRIERRYFGKPAWVFNEAQVDGYAPPEPDKPLTEFERCEQAEALLAAVGAKVEEGHSVACYRPDDDVIQMPKWEWFLASETSSAMESYYAVRFHETIHWTGARHRLNREFGRRFGDQAYAMEELVAEIGAAFLCSGYGISSEPRADHAAYISNWLAVLRNDNRAIFTAASLAQEAFEYLFFLATKDKSDDLSAAKPVSLVEAAST